MPNRLPKRLYADLSGRWPALLAAGLTLGALALLWRVRDTPLARGEIARIDALSALFLLALFGGAALALAAHPAVSARRLVRPAAAAGALALAYSTTLTPAIAGAYVLLALLTLDRRGTAAQAHGAGATQFARLAWAIRRMALAAPGLLAAGCLLLGCGALALRGAPRYDDRIAGLALDSFAFWFVLLAAAIACSPLFHPTIDLSTSRFLSVSKGRTGDRRFDAAVPERVEGQGGRPATADVDDKTRRQSDKKAIEQGHPVARSGGLAFAEMGLFRFAWLYPLARLYSLGPWNSGWSFATLLLGGALALWCACSALARPNLADRGARLQSIYLALALAGLGLSTSAGVAAACYGMLAYLVLAVGHSDRGLGIHLEQGSAHPPPLTPQLPTPSLLPWLLSSALPLTAPFVAAWMLIGASVAGGVALLAGVAWLVALLHGLIVALWGRQPAVEARRQLLVAGAASLLLGVGAPPIVRALIQPAVAQLQGGLTPYGDVNIWPWVGLATSDSAHTQVTTLPSIAIALLMLVLSALVYVVARLRGARAGSGQDDAAGTPAPAPTLLSELRDEVPWLGGLLGSDPRSQRQPGDGE